MSFNNKIKQNLDMKKNKGFTLIELLVVIAIIGILSAVVLASLNTARDRGADAAKMANLNNIRAQAELSYDKGSNDGYDGVCDDDIVERAILGSKGTIADNCFDSAAEWAATVELSGSNGWYCVDSTGNATTTTTKIAAGSNIKCK